MKTASLIAGARGTRRAAFSLLGSAAAVLAFAVPFGPAGDAAAPPVGPPAARERAATGAPARSGNAAPAAPAPKAEGQSPPAGRLGWRHLSTANGDLPAPGKGTQQTACLVLDVDRDGASDFVVAERTASPSVVWFRRTAKGWDRYVVEAAPLHIEAGGAAADIDGDGDLDIIFGGDASSNEVWWWENPGSGYEPTKPWTRRAIKGDGARKHHHQIFGDFNGDGRGELVFWNQGDRKLFLAEVPPDPRKAGPWARTAIYSWAGGAEHEGLAAADIDGDGKLDLVGGGNWYKHEGDGKFTAHTIDAAKRFSSAAAGQLKKGGWAEAVFVPGDADGPLTWYEWDGKAWVGHVLVEKVVHGHTLQLADFDKDGNLDIFVAEMAKWGKDVSNPGAKARIFYGDGTGGFEEQVVSVGIAHHESKVGDLDGDGDVDILGKPYNWQTPRLDIWLNEGPGRPTASPQAGR